MSDSIAAYVRAHDLGRIERRLPVRGQLDVPGAGPLTPELCLTSHGLWLVAAAEPEGASGVALDLLDRDDLSYRSSKRTDEIVVAGQAFEVPAGRREETRAAIGIGRLRGRQPVLPTIIAGRFVEAPSDIERAALGRWLVHEELLLAHLRTATVVPVSPSAGRRPQTSPVTSPFGDAAGRIRFVLSDRRVALFTLSELGDLSVEELDARSLSADATRAELTLGGRTLAPDRNAALFAALAYVPALGPDERVLEVARLNWLDREATDVRLAAARSLLERLARRGHPIARIGQYLIAVELEEPVAARPELDRISEELDAAGVPVGSIAELFRAWLFSADAGRTLLERMRTDGATLRTLALHAALREHLLGAARNPSSAALVDIEYAEHAILVGERDRARRLLEERLVSLPPRSVREVALSSASEGAALAVRTRVTELLVEARGSATEPDVWGLAELARLQPLVRSRAATLAEATTGELADRARAISELLEPAALLTPAEAPLDPSVRPLRPELIESALAHGIEVERDQLLAGLQTLVASAAPVDYSAVRSYCEALPSDPVAPATRALADAARVFGVPGVEGYISRGKKDVGIRAFDGQPPFVLIGGRHLDAGSDHRMTAAELRFALAAEVAHLRFDNARVTADAVWEGAIAKSRQGLDVILGILPMVAGLRVAGRFGQVVSQLDKGAIRRALQSASTLNDALQRALGSTRQPEDAAIATANEKLIFAHRLMQLIADRAGLLLAVSPRAAIRSMFLVRREYTDALRRSASQGLGDLLQTELSTGDPAFYDLAVRIGALIAFFLSDEFVRLRDGLRG